MRGEKKCIVTGEHYSHQYEQYKKLRFIIKKFRSKLESLQLKIFGER